jgi:hypothetical protein
MLLSYSLAGGDAIRRTAIGPPPSQLARRAFSIKRRHFPPGPIQIRERDGVYRG